MRNRRPAVAYAPRVTVVVISMAVVVSLLPLPAHAQTGSRPDEWRFYGGGPLLTKTLLFIGQGIESHTLRAFDKDTGYELFEIALPARSSSAPITYLAGGRQYIVLAIGGGDITEQLIALALPEGAR